MEKLTINEAILKIAELERNYRYELQKTLSIDNASITYILESNGNRFDCDEKVDFKKELSELILLLEEIEILKTAIAYANNTTELDVLGTRISIQRALNRVKLKRELATNIEYLLRQIKVSKERKVDAAATSVYYKVTELNFDRQEMEILVKDLNKEILELEIAINKANNETFIEI